MPTTKSSTTRLGVSKKRRLPTFRGHRVKVKAPASEEPAFERAFSFEQLGLVPLGESEASTAPRRPLVAGPAKLGQAAPQNASRFTALASISVD
jgi:hypothetical protein